MLEVIVPADDPWLLTIEQARVAAGLAEDDESQDASLELLRATVSSQIYDALNIAVGRGAEPTIRRETLKETLTVHNSGPVVLKRRHDTDVVEIEGWPGVLAEGQYITEAEAGIIYRSEPHLCWPHGMVKTTITYEAGFDEVPPILVSAASEMLRLRQSETSRDPLVKREVVDVDGVDRIEQEFWVTSAGSTAATEPVPPNVMVLLKRFRNSAFA